MLYTIWEQFLEIVKKEAGSRVVETWLKAVSLHRWDALQKIVYLNAPNQFVKEWIKSNYLLLFQTHFSRLLNVDTLKIVFIDTLVHNDQSTVETTKIVPAQLIPLTQEPAENQLVKATTYNKHALNCNYVFDTFVVGPNNQMAYAAARAVTKKLGKLYNPLFLYGGSGLGKTHLLYAIANDIKASNKNIEVLYQPADRFVNEFISAIRFDKIHRFQAKYKDIDVLLIDDIQFISNKEQTQEAFFHIFNNLYNDQKQIVFSSDSYPADIDGLAERLRSRLEMGLVADIQVPSFETKIAILQRKAELSDEQIPYEVASFIASRSFNNIRELEGALIRVIAFGSLTKQPITLELAKHVLLRAKNTQQVGVDFDVIVKSLSYHYPYTLADLRSRNRAKDLSLARQVAMYLMKKLTNKSLHEIAYYFERTDHSTVIHALKQIQDRLRNDQTFGNHIRQLEEEIIS